MAFDQIGRGTVANDGTGDSARTGAGKINALIAAANAGQFQSFRNALINGAFNVWQRGTSFGSIANLGYFADRWCYLKSGAMVHDVSRSADVPTVAQAGQLFNYSVLVDCTTVDASIAAGDHCSIAQAIEGFNWAAFAQRGCVKSFWVKATKIGIYCVALRNSGADRSYVGEYTINVADTWELKTVTFTASPSAGTWDYTTGVGAWAHFTLAAGSTFQTTAGAWATGNYLATANQVNACDSTSNNFRTTGVQLEACDSTELDATPFEHVPFEVDLARCQRYYEKSFAYADAPGAPGDGGAEYSKANGTAHFHYIRFKQRKRVTPTVTAYNPTTGGSGTWRDGTASTNLTATPAASGEVGTTIVITSSVDQNSMAGHWTASAEL